MNELLPVLLLNVVAVASAAGSNGLSNLVGPRHPNPTKLGAYESGNEPLADVPGTRSLAKFFMVAMLFLIFDVEAVFVYPWAVVLRGSAGRGSGRWWCSSASSGSLRLPSMNR